MAQRRPLTRAETPLQATTATTIIHDFDTLSRQNGGPEIDQISLWVHNPTGGALANVQVLVGGVLAANILSLAAGAIVQVFDGVAMRCPENAATRTIQFGLLAGGVGPIGWGYFTRGIST